MSNTSLTITEKKKISRSGIGFKWYVVCSCTANDLDENGYPIDESFPDSDHLANGSVMLLTDSRKVKVFDEANTIWRDW